MAARHLKQSCTTSNGTRTVRSWSDRYGRSHRLERITDFPRGIAGPEKVRIYWRRDHYVLQWWDRSERKTLSDRVDEDLVAAISRARDIERRMSETGRSGIGHRRLTISDLIQRYVAEARERAESGEIDLRSVARYESALEYLQRFSEQLKIARTYPHAACIDRKFVLEFGAFLQVQLISPNGHENSLRRQMRGQHYVLAAARSVFGWASDPDRGNLLPAEFRSPFQATAGMARRPAIDLTREPPISIDMALQFIANCDAYQLRVFLPLILFGLRASEPMWLFHEDIERGWLNVQCHPELDYLTKGRRDKRFPLIRNYADLWGFLAPPGSAGLLLRRRQVIAAAEAEPPVSFDGFVATYQLHCRTQINSVAARRVIRDRLLSDSGGLNYDQIEGEFQKIAKGLGWKGGATLKGFRHLFATALENSGCPESYRRYFLGHSPGRAASANYTHLDQLERHFSRLLEEEFARVVAAIRDRIRDVTGDMVDEL